MGFTQSSIWCWLAASWKKTNAFENCLNLQKHQLCILLWIGLFKGIFSEHNQPHALHICQWHRWIERIQKVGLMEDWNASLIKFRSKQVYKRCYMIAHYLLGLRKPHLLKRAKRSQNTPSYPDTALQNILIKSVDFVELLWSEDFQTRRQN